MRRIKTLGLCAVAALALTAFPAGASASGGIEADEYSAFLQGSGAPGTQKLAFNGGLAPVVNTCGSAFTAELSGPSATFEAAPTWSSCWPKAINANGCELEFQIGSESSVEIGPSNCGPITTSALGCQVSIAQDSTKAPVVSYENLGKGSTASVDISVEIPLLYTASGAQCTVSPKTGTALYKGEWNVIGLDEFGNPIGIHATDELATGLFVEGEESEVPAEQPRFAAEAYPASIAGEGDELRLGVGVDSVRCDLAHFDGAVTGESSELALEATYGQCTLLALPAVKATIDMNDCQYALSASNAGPPYEGDTELTCAGEGEAIEVGWQTFVGKCTMSISPQSLGGVSYDNLGTGSSRTVAAEANGSGIAYSWSQTGTYGCFRSQATGSAENGTLKGGIGLRAFR